MFGILLTLFSILCIFLAIFIFIQQGKGDMGLGSLGAQSLFGGSGGQDFFEKATWVMGALFILGALGLSMLHISTNRSRVANVPVNKTHSMPQIPTEHNHSHDTEHETEAE